MQITQPKQLTYKNTKQLATNYRPIKTTDPW